MPEPVSETVDNAVEAVNVGNVKTVAEAAAVSLAQTFQDQAAHRARLNVLAEQLLSVAAKGLHEVDPTEAISTLKTLTGNDPAQSMNAILAALAANQQNVKAAQTTPPTS